MYEYEFLYVKNEFWPGTSVLAHILGHHVFHTGSFLLEVAIHVSRHIVLGLLPGLTHFAL